MDFGIEPGAGAGLLLGWLSTPYDPERLIATMLGLSPRVSRQLVGTVLATCDEAEELITAMPTILRSLAIATSNRPQRCYSEVRGPILWSETMAARAASAGDEGLFVCATASRAYDTDENRVLRAALEAVHRAGREAERGPDDSDEGVVRRARHNGHQAARLLDHQALVQVTSRRPTGRELRRTRAGSRRGTYRPALRMLARAERPLDATHVHAFATERTRAQLDLFAAVLARLEQVTGMPPVVRRDAAQLVSGPVSFLHSTRRDASTRWLGVRVRDLLIDVPDPLDEPPETGQARLEERAEGGAAILATTAADVERAVTEALG